MVDVGDLEVHAAEHALVAEAEIAQAVVEIDPDQLGVALIVVGAQEEQLAAERRGVDPGQAGELEGGSGPEPVGAIALGIEIAVPDQKAIADVEFLPARRQVERVLAQGVGQ